MRTNNCMYLQTRERLDNLETHAFHRVTNFHINNKIMEPTHKHTQWRKWHMLRIWNVIHGGSVLCALLSLCFSTKSSICQSTAEPSGVSASSVCPVTINLLKTETFYSCPSVRCFWHALQLNYYERFALERWLCAVARDWVSFVVFRQRVA